MGKHSMTADAETLRAGLKKRKNGFVAELKRHWGIYLIMLPGILYYLIFKYGSMAGVIIAFEDYTPARGMLGSQWVGFEHFKEFFSDIYFFRVLKNTITLSLYDLLVGFPAPIILALLLNEIKNERFKKLVQTVTYLPHFISMVVICGLVITFCYKDGLINDILAMFGLERKSLLMEPQYYKTIHVFSGVWQQVGWGSIVYLAALTNVDMELYEAATLDGAGRWKQTLHVTLPGILPTIVTLLLLRIGSLMSVGYEKVILLYNPGIYETADIISSYVYRNGLTRANYSYSAAIDLLNSIINLVLLIGANFVSKRVNDVGLW